jgi:hypothetical protein
MRLVPRHRRRRRGIAPRVAISQAEIDADLSYRGERQPRHRGRRQATAE